jgi:hypothetical protein
MVEHIGLTISLLPNHGWAVKKGTHFLLTFTTPNLPIRLTRILGNFVESVGIPLM